MRSPVGTVDYHLDKSVPFSLFTDFALGWKEPFPTAGDLKSPRIETGLNCSLGSGPSVEHRCSISNPPWFTHTLSPCHPNKFVSGQSLPRVLQVISLASDHTRLEFTVNFSAGF